MEKEREKERERERERRSMTINEEIIRGFDKIVNFKLLIFYQYYF